MGVSEDYKLGRRILGAYVGLYILFIGISMLYDRVEQSSKLSLCDIKTHYPQHTFKKVTWNGGGVVTFWFDNGGESLYTEGFPALAAMDYPAVVSVTSEFICKSNYLTWNQLRFLQSQGWNMAVQLTPRKCEPQESIDPQQFNSDVSQAKKSLQSKGIKADLLVTPCGINNSIIKNTAQQYFNFSRTRYEGIELMPLDDSQNLHVLVLNSNTRLNDVEQWLNYAKFKRAWLILQIDGLQDNPSALSIHNFQEIIKLIKQNELQVVLPEWLSGARLVDFSRIPAYK